MKMSFCVYGELFILDLEKVMYLEADDHYTIVYYASGGHFMLPFGLSCVLETLEKKEGVKEYLIRLGRKYVVNTNYIMHVNVAKQIIQMYDNKGEMYTLHFPKQVLREFIVSIKKTFIEDS